VFVLRSIFRVVFMIYKASKIANYSKKNKRMHSCSPCFSTVEKPKAKIIKRKHSEQIQLDKHDLKDSRLIQC